MQRWTDPHSGRRVWVIAARDVDEWPDALPWSCTTFGLLVAAEHAEDVEPLARRALDQGLAFACAWGPGCALTEEGFDDVVAEAVSRRDGAERSADVVWTSSHANESLEEAIEFFLDAARPVRPRVDECEAWCVFAIGPSLPERVERALRRRGAVRR